MKYEDFHILDLVIEDETQHNGRDVTINVDTHEMVTIKLGNTVTVRTDEAGVDDLRDALHRALVQLEDIRYQKAREQAAEDAWQTSAEAEMIQSGIDAREKMKDRALSEQQRVDVWNPHDPVNW